MRTNAGGLPGGGAQSTKLDRARVVPPQPLTGHQLVADLWVMVEAGKVDRNVALMVEVTLRSIAEGIDRAEAAGAWSVAYAIVDPGEQKHPPIQHTPEKS